MKRTIITTAILLTACTLWAQVPVPAPPQEGPILLKGAVIHVGNGTKIENGAIAFSEGKITAVGKAGEVSEAGHQVIDLTGKQIYPGFILPDVQIGLVEVSSVRATVDTSETGLVNPNVRAITSYNTDSEIIPTYRFNGILTAQSVPTGGLVSGTSSVVQLDAWNWEDAAYSMDEGLHINWPGKMRRQFDRRTFTVRTVPNERYDETVRALDKAFADAISYGKTTNRKTNIKMEAMLGIFSGDQTLYLHTNDAKSMIAGVTFAKKHGVKKVVIVGGAQALMAKQFLVEHDIPVILTSVHALPGRGYGSVDEAFERPLKMKEAGIRFAIGYSSTTNGRNLAFTAGTAVAYGLPYEDAVRAITLSTAEILGVADTLGSLEQGKDATLFVSAGDALDMRSQLVEHAFIQGRKIQVEGRQQALFERYREKYGHEDGK